MRIRQWKKGKRVKSYSCCSNSHHVCQNLAFFAVVFVRVSIVFGVMYVRHRAEGDLETFKNDVVVVWLVSCIILSSEIP